MRKTTIIAAAAVLAAAAPVQAQATPNEAPAAAQKSPEEVRRQILAELKAEMFKEGEVLAGFDAGGGDPEAAVTAAGADTHYLLVTSDKQKHVAIVTDKPLSRFVPTAWRAVDSVGSAVDYAEHPSVSFGRLSKRYVLGLRSSGWREKGLDCTKGFTHGVLYEIPEAPSSAEDEVIGQMFRLLLEAAQGETVCSRAVGDAAKGWVLTYMRPDGHLLPGLNSPPDRAAIVPAGSIETLLGG